MSDYTPTTEEVRDAYESTWLSDTMTGRDAEFNRWLAERDREIVARTLAAQSTSGVCQVNDPDLEWEGWVEEATELIKGEEK